ncbi:MAG: ATP-dependent 6-phosphofructokinase [bacterium]|nr:ATP-dependent 6-phosphofructokinase [bacterium]
MAVSDIQRIGVLTGGGDCPGLNAVIRAVTKTANRVYGLTVVGIEDGFDGLLQPYKAKEITPDVISGILSQGGTILGTTNRGNPFEYKRKLNNKIVQEDISDIAVKNFHALNLDALIVIGGDGSLKIADKFYKEKGIPVVGIPKTIDNDLESTDMTFGFRTAVMTATEAIDKLHTTAESHHRIMILELMGRYVGWIALESGIAGGADIIAIPEIPYNIDKIAEKVNQRNSVGKKFSIIVVAEGAKSEGGSLAIKSPSGKELGAERLGGAGERLGQELKEITDIEYRVTVLGHLQRGGSPSALDRILSTRFGEQAVHLVMKKDFGKMVCLKTPHIKSVTMEEAVSKFKSVDPEGELVKTAESIGVCFGR